ncbi:hypothetical protein [Nonomuraea composti]|nr:hypothetical protein [Nonomuraea sp. FMUSA5-5]
MDVLETTASGSSRGRGHGPLDLSPDRLARLTAASDRYAATRAAA